MQYLRIELTGTISYGVNLLSTNTRKQYWCVEKKNTNIEKKYCGHTVSYGIKHGFAVYEVNTGRVYNIFVIIIAKIGRVLYRCPIVCARSQKKIRILFVILRRVFSDVHVYRRLRISTPRIYRVKEALPVRPANDREPVSSSKVERKSPPADGSATS